MAETTYQCLVNKTHTKKIYGDQKAAPYCCGKPMTKVQASAPAPTAAKPQGQAPAQPAAATPSAAKPAQPQQMKTK